MNFIVFNANYIHEPKVSSRTGQLTEMAAKTFKQVILQRIHNHSLPGGVQADRTTKAVSTIADCMVKTVNTGLGDSVLLVGSYSSGKSMVVERALERLSREASQKYTVVRLNGLVHRDDKLALMEIATALKMSEVCESVLQASSMEEDEEEEEEEGGRSHLTTPPAAAPGLSLARALEVVLTALRVEGDSRARSVVVLLEEVHLFAHHHLSQTLLYNLFELSQSGRVPLMVLGITPRLDVMGLLEKRVKSRFSHNQIHLFPDLSFEQYRELFRSLLTVPAKEGGAFGRKWTTAAKGLSSCPAVTAILKDLYIKSKNVRSLKKFLVLVVCSCLAEVPHAPALKDCEAAAALLARDSKDSVLRSLTLLEMILVLAMKRLKEVLLSTSSLTFEMVYKEYKEFTQSHHTVPLYKRAVAMKTFEHLQALQIVASVEGVAGGGRGQLKEYAPVVLTVSPDQVLRALAAHASCSVEVHHWGSSPGVLL